MQTKTLDDAAALFHDYPTRENALHYEALAILAAVAMIITIDELKNIVALVSPYVAKTLGGYHG